MAASSAQATQDNATATARTNAARAASAGSTGSEPGSNLAKSELLDIADLRKRMTARTVTLTRHAETGDIAIQVWARTTLPKKYYVAVTQQGTVRRTLTATDEAEAWRSYDSFRRMAGLGEVGRPVLLGQMTVEPAPSARIPLVMAAGALPSTPTIPSSPVPPPQTVFPTPVPATPPTIQSPVQSAVQSPIAPMTPPLRTNPVPELEAVARAPAPKAETPMAAREISATTGEAVNSRGDLRVAGAEVETLRRARFGDEVARLVWSAESSQYFVSLTRQGSVVAMLRSRDSAEATRAYEDYVRQAEKRASLLPGRAAGAMSSASR
ncbi:DUF2968 domain-containing protein [Roseateles sp. L2-2]|uniref:DUF2968 domain-containing protein n=1 Tax=Roseateles sp. L2-2 TaxID=3422597 RepID=UPI003D35CF38